MGEESLAKGEVLPTSSAIACRRSQAPVASDPMLLMVAHRSRLLCGDLHVAGGHPHASGRVVPWSRPTVGTLVDSFADTSPLPLLPTGDV